MKRLFRDRKLSFGSSSKPTVSAPAPLAPASQDAPLYARFATVDRRDANEGPSKPIVSAPMQLTSKASRTSVSRAPSSNAGGRSADRHSKVLTRKQSRQDGRGQAQSDPQVLASPESRSAHKLPSSAPPVQRTSMEVYKADVLSPPQVNAGRYAREEDGRRQDAARRASTYAADPRQGGYPFPHSAQVEQWDSRGESAHSPASVSDQPTIRPNRKSVSRAQSRDGGGPQDPRVRLSMQSQQGMVASPGSHSSRELQPASPISAAMTQGDSSRAAVSVPAQLSSRTSRLSFSRASTGGAGGLTNDPSVNAFVSDQAVERRRHDSRRSEDASFSASGSVPRLPLVAPSLSGITLESHKLDMSAVLQIDTNADEREDDQVENTHITIPAADSSYSLSVRRRSRTGSSSSLSSGTEWSSSAPRKLVVRNAAPDDVDDTASESMSDLAAVGRYMNSRDHRDSPRVSSPLVEPRRPNGFANGHGFALPADEPRSPLTSAPKRNGHASLPPAAVNSAVSPDTHTARATAQYTSLQVSSSVAVPDPNQASQAAPLQSSPSVTRKKYSPLAAFGLPQPRSPTTATPPSPTAGSSSDANSQGYAANGPARDQGMLLSQAPVQSLSSRYSPSPTSAHGGSYGGGGATSGFSRRLSKAEEAAYEEAVSRRQAVAEQAPPAYEEVYDLSESPAQRPISIASTQTRDTSDRSMYQRPASAYYDPAPAAPSAPLQHASSVRLQPSRQSSFMSNYSAQGARGRPLIFQAMDTTAEVNGIAPEIVGMIGKASVYAKGQELDNRYHTSPAPAQPSAPVSRSQTKKDKKGKEKERQRERDDFEVKKKPSKLHKRGSHSKADPVEAMMRGMEKRHRDALNSPHNPTSPHHGPPQRLSMHGDHSVGPSSPTENIQRLDHNSVHSPQDIAERQRRDDGFRHLTERQREMLQHRASYAADASAQQQVPQTDNHRASMVDPHMPQWRSDTAAYAAQFPRATAYMPAEMAGAVSPAQYANGLVHSPEADASRRLPWQAQVQGYGSQPPSHRQPNGSGSEFAEPGQYAPSTPAGTYQQGFPTSPPSNRLPPAVRQQSLPPLPTPPQIYTSGERGFPEKTRKSTRKRREKAMGSESTTSEPTFYPLAKHLSDPGLAENLLGYLSYYEWTTLCVSSKQIRQIMYVDRREQVLERYLRTVGYEKWAWSHPEPLILTVQDLCDYMHGVSIPSHRYAAIANNFLQPNSTVDSRTVQELSSACRAFTRVVLRLRCQAEAEAAHNARLAQATSGSVSSLPARMNGNAYRSPPAGYPPNHPSNSAVSLSHNSSRAPSPASSYSNLHGAQTRSNTMPMRPGLSANGNGSGSISGSLFQSPLYRLRRAPLLKVFVPSPEGDWLSDSSVVECEAELRRAGVLNLMRAGDVVWDVAAGDEGNVGRLVWDGSYLIDLDYTYSRVGDPPRYLPSLAFPPSYYHRIIRTLGAGNPVIRMDIAPWGDEILKHVRLLQDRIKTETPQGGRHTVVRWVHRSSFTIRVPPGSKSIRLPMPLSSGPGPSPTGAWVVDPDWFGTVVVETEGTNEGQADLQARCRGVRMDRPSADVEAEKERRTVWRILREKSRPGEIWIRAVTHKERLVPG